MKTYIYLTLKYWRKHKKNAAALLFAGVLLTAVVFLTLMSNRERWVRQCHKVFDKHGHLGCILVGSDDETLSKLTAGKTGYNYGAIYVYGTLGIDDKQFTYGTIDDKKDVMHIPLDEGRMPQTDTEIAASVKVLNALFWVGKCGDTIKLDDNTYTVVGIINEDYDDRYGVDDELRQFSANGPFDSTYRIPSVFIGKSDKEPLYRIDMLNNLDGMPLVGSTFDTVDRYLYDVIREFNKKSLGWTDCGVSTGEACIDAYEDGAEPSFFLIIAMLGSIIAALSVYSILRNVFAERQSRIETLKKIGMTKRAVGCMYAVECVAYTLIQTFAGLVVGLGVYGGIFMFKTSVLREKPYSGFTDIKRVLSRSPDPFLFACVISVIVMVGAYLISAFSSKHKEKTPKKCRKPRSLFRCFGRVFRQKGVTVVQTVALTLIYFSVIMGYMYYTDNGKGRLKEIMHTSYREDLSGYYYVNSFNMEKENIAEYYSSPSPGVTSLGNMNNEPHQCFPFVEAGYSAGFDDETAAKLPDHTTIAGKITHAIIVSDEPKDYINEIDLSNEAVRRSFLGLSDEKYQNFFEEGQLGSKNMYRIDTKLTTADSIEALSEYTLEGDINIDAINSGEEILVAYKGGKRPQFEIGETVTLYTVTATESGYGVGGISSGEVRIGAILRIPPSIGELEYYAVRNEQDYNFLTTATGAENIGLPYARYTEIYSSEPMDGSVIPSSAKMSVMSLEKMKWDNLKNKIIKISGMAMITVLMVLIGFAAYFNGIGMKIREKRYEISALRAVGTPLSVLRKRMLLGSIKIPFIAAAASYGLVKTVQFIMASVENYKVALFDMKNNSGGITNIDPEVIQIELWMERLFLKKGMWAVNAEIPTLILLAVICAVTFILTAVALKKFKRDIAFDLNSGRTKQ